MNIGGTCHPFYQAKEFSHHKSHWLFLFFLKTNYMKLLIAPLFMIATVSMLVSCGGSSSTPATFCDTTCLKDTLKFAGNHQLEPFVYLSVKDCKPDSIIWSYKGLGSNRKTKFDYTSTSVNKDYIRCIFNDTTAAFILFNDCLTGRGFQIKLPFSKSENFSMRTSGINSIDPKFSVSENLMAYTDRGNIYIEEFTTGKKAMMTFGEKLDIDYDAIHEHIDSVNVTNSRIWVKVKKGKEWAVLEKNITLE